MRIKLLAATTAITMISGCADMQKNIASKIEQTDTKASTLVNDVGHTAPGVVGKEPPTAEHENGIWLGKNVVKVNRAALPPLFDEPATFDRTVHSLSELAERITLRSGIPTKVSPDAIAISNGVMQSTGNNGAVDHGAQGAMPTTLPRQGSAQSKGPIRITYSNGNFKGMLDTVSARFGVYWKYTNGTIQFFHTDSRSFQIDAIPGDSTFSATVTSGATSTGSSSSGGTTGGGTSGVTANNSQNTAVNSQLSVYSSIEKSIVAMLSPYGKVVASPATGTMTVVDTPDTLDRVAAFVENENKSLSRQISVNVTVLAVTLAKTDNYGIQWDLVYKNLFSKYSIKNTLASVGGTALSAGILSTSNSKFAGSEMVIQALSQQGKVRRETTASVVTLNNQPVPVQVAKQTTYLKSSQTTITALVGASTTLTPGTVTSGFNMSILPHVLNNGTVMLQFSTDISALRGFRTVTSNGSSIETPEIDTRNFLQRVSMKSNETLIISGFEQTDDNLDQNGVGTPTNYLLGGGFNGTSNKEVIVILITPTTVSGS
ncbi:MAG: PilN family type IVB pilus formation outer membrane protein [Burkholderiaceae bacterium]